MKKELKLFYALCIAEEGAFTKASFALNSENQLSYSLCEGNSEVFDTSNFNLILNAAEGNLDDQLFLAVRNLISHVAFSNEVSQQQTLKSLVAKLTL